MKNLKFIFTILIILLIGGCADKGVYVGEEKDGKRHGQGTVTYSNGKKYDGEFKKGQKSGHGTQIWSDGRKYTGEWEDGKITGIGVMTNKDGTKFDGEWKRGRPVNGKGVIQSRFDRKEGEWINGKMEGYGKLSNNNNKVWYKSYEGELKNGKFYGQGKMTAKKVTTDDMGRNPRIAKLKGLIFIGKFKNGRPHNVKSYNDSGEEQTIIFLNGKLGGM